MISNLMIQIGGAVVALVGLLGFGYVKGRKDAKIKSLEEGVKNALESKKRSDKRRRDSIDAVLKRMRKFTSK